MKRFVIFCSLLVLGFSCRKTTEAPPSLQPETIGNVSYGSDAQQKMDVYLPAGRSQDSTRMIVLVHGGAWTMGDKSDFAPYIPTLQEKLPHYAIANINYRLASALGNHFPVQENDMKAAIAFLLHKTADYQISGKLVLLGASAGAHMALLQAYKNQEPKILAVVDFFGPVDMSDLYNHAANPANQLGIQVLMNGTPSTNPALYQQSSPINFVSAQSPPTLIFHGTDDVVVNPAQSTALSNRLDSMDVPHQLVFYPNLGHELWPAPVLNDAFDKMEAFIKTNVH